MQRRLALRNASLNALFPLTSFVVLIWLCGCSVAPNASPVANQRPENWLGSARTAGSRTNRSGLASNSGSGTADPDAAWIARPRIEVLTAENDNGYVEVPTAFQKTITKDPTCKNLLVVRVRDIDRVKTAQVSESLCWAACAQMLLAQTGHRVDQLSLGTKYRPDVEDKASGLGIIMRALCPELESKLSRYSSTPTEYLGVHSDQMLSELAAGRMCIVGLLDSPDDPVGHACVITEATFGKRKPSDWDVATDIADFAGFHYEDKQHPRAPLTGYALRSVTIFDPAPGVGSRTLSGDEFAAQATFITSRQIAHVLLERAAKKPPDSNPRSISQSKDSKPHNNKDNKPKAKPKPPTTRKVEGRKAEKKPAKKPEKKPSK